MESHAFVNRDCREEFGVTGLAFEVRIKAEFVRRSAFGDKRISSRKEVLIRWVYFVL